MNENTTNINDMTWRQIHDDVDVAHIEGLSQIVLNLHKGSSLSVGVSVPFFAITSSDPTVVSVSVQGSLISIQALKQGDVTLTATVIGHPVGSAATKVW
jgi:uncharacterized protein YjdB